MSDRIGWFHCVAGIAGDMALGACFAAGADVDEVRAVLGQVPVRGWTLDTVEVTRAGLVATKAVVKVADAHHHGHPQHQLGPSDVRQGHRPAREVLELIEGADLPARVAERSLAVFGALTAVEARLHGTTPGEVHLHELGGLDTIIDVVGTCAALELLGVDRVACSPVAVGQGTVRTSHGIVPNPAPATLELLAGRPVVGLDARFEITTPTGAALMAALADHWGPLPAMRIEAAGFGAGDQDFPERANLARLVVGVGAHASTVPGSAPGPQGRSEVLTLLETNVDDVTGEMLGHALEEVLAAGALDAWISPVTMKKSRPGHTLHVLCTAEHALRLQALVVAETGTLGVRTTRVDRWAAERRVASVVIRDREIRLKGHPGRWKPEYDDVAAVARDLGVPLRVVLAEAAVAASRLDGGTSASS